MLYRENGFSPTERQYCDNPIPWLRARRTCSRYRRSPSVSSSRFAFIALSVRGKSAATERIARSAKTGKHADYGVLTVKTPKLHFLDSGLLATVRGLTLDRVRADHGAFGALLESFVFSEVLKLMSASDLRLTPYHFRDRDMREVAVVLERTDGKIAGIEVKVR